MCRNRLPIKTKDLDPLFMDISTNCVCDHRRPPHMQIKPDQSAFGQATLMTVKTIKRGFSPATLLPEQENDPRGCHEETLASFLFCVTTLNCPESMWERKGRCCWKMVPERRKEKERERAEWCQRIGTSTRAKNNTSRNARK